MLLSPIGSPTRALAHLALPPIVVPGGRGHSIARSLSSPTSPLPAIAAPGPIAALNFGPDDDDDAQIAGDIDLEIELALPVELILYIVELAAATSRKAACALALVSSWVRDAALPALYDVVVLQGSMRSPFVPAPPSPTPGLLSSPLRHIQHLWIDNDTTHWPDSLTGCTSLKQLAIHLDGHRAISQAYVWRDDDDGAHSTARPTHVTSLTVLGQSHPMRWAPLTDSPACAPFLRGLTHLRLLNMCLSSFLPLSHMPSLTHLCVPFFDLRAGPSDSTFAAVDAILAFTNLQQIVLTMNPRYWKFEAMSFKRWARLALEKDERLYAVVSIREDATKDWEDARKDWENEARGGESIWEKAIKIRRKFLSRASWTA